MANRGNGPYPIATRADHRRFCDLEGWEQRPTHHLMLRLRLPDGRILITRISHPADRTTYSRSMWVHILRDQLEVEEAEFWACVRDRVLPDRGAPEEVRPGLPYRLLHELVKVVGLPAADAAAMTPDEARARIAEYWRDVAERSAD